MLGPAMGQTEIKNKGLRRIVMIYRIVKCDIVEEKGEQIAVIRVENVNSPNWFVELKISASEVVNLVDQKFLDKIANKPLIPA